MRETCPVYFGVRPSFLLLLIPSGATVKETGGRVSQRVLLFVIVFLSLSGLLFGFFLFEYKGVIRADFPEGCPETF